MKRYSGISFACLCSLLLAAGIVFAHSAADRQQIAVPQFEPGVVGDVDGVNPSPQKALQDTVWIADWSFDTGAPCSEAGWTHVDNHILNDGANYWHIETGFTTPSGVTGKSAAVGYHGNVCCTDADGYDNDWYQAIRITYTGAATISLDYIVDSEAGYDFLQIETDSACASFGRVDLVADPSATAAAFRSVEGEADGLRTNGEWICLALTDYGAGTHCVYVSFFSDAAFSPCDGNQPTTVGEATVVDNIVVVDGSGTRSENFEDGFLNLGTFVNIADSAPFGTWARVFRHVTDNDLCTENTTCAWLWTDHVTPTLFNDPSMAFGPGGFVIRNWLDDIIVSPWVSLASTPTAAGTVLQFRRFPGNFFSTSRIVQNWSVRGRSTIAGTQCPTAWAHVFDWNSLSFFGWQDLLFDMSATFDPTVEEIQVRHRTSDWQWIAGASPPLPFMPGPGPYTDRTRIGRRILSGPVIDIGLDTRFQAQDAFPTEIDPTVTPAGEHHRPTTDRFGSCAYSMGGELTINKTGPNIVTGDSTYVQVRGVRVGGEVVTAVQFCGAIVRGPHSGKAPPPYSVGGNGFFCVAADTVRNAFTGQVVPEFYFKDFDDTYFRGGDELHYFWAATDNGGGFTSDPLGLAGMPVSVAAAQVATDGLREVSYLPSINWAPGYLARIAADSHGDLDPTPAELAASSQANCILYVNHVVNARRGGDTQRTSFMYTLDRLGYRGHYDVYDHQGMGNTNNHLGSRATIEQAQGYNLIVYDSGINTPGYPIMPDGVDLDAEKVDQASWFRNWVAQASISQAGFVTLWVLGSNAVQEHPANAFYNTTMGVALQAADQALNVNPNVLGIAAFAFDQGVGQATVSYAGDLYALNGGCPVLRNYNALQTSAGTAVRTHNYQDPVTGSQGGGAIVMNRNNAEQWNTIMQSHAWFDVRDKPGTPANPSPERVLLAKTLGAVLPAACLQGENPTDTGPGDEIDIVRQTALYQNVPNPFNPTTKIRFDLAQSGRVQLRIYDVAGRLVRTLLDKEMQAGRDQSVVWNGLDEQNHRTGSGVYFYRLEAVNVSLTKKMVVMK